MDLRCRRSFRWKNQAGFAFCLIFLSLLTSLRTRAQDVTSVFVAPAQPLIYRAPVSLWLYSLNNSATAQPTACPATINGTLISAAATNSIVLTLNSNGGSNTVNIAPGAFSKMEYTLSLPPGMTGPIRLEAANYSPVLFTVAGGSSVAGTNLAVVPRPAQTSAVQSPQVADKLMRFLDKHISPYEPIYFLLGSYPAAKFQFSLKYEVLNYTNKNNPLSDLYFAYTQTSFWDLVTKDPLFYDTSYKPSAFLYYPDLSLRPIDSKLDLQAGMEHESNGRGGTDERSLNTIYFQPTLTYQPLDDLSFSLQPRFWYYLTVGDNDTDLANYRGYGDVLGTVRWKDIAFATKLRMGKDWDHQGWQFDLWFELPDWFHFNPALQVEYFTGYGQSLRQYNESSHGIRGGLSLWY